MNIKQAEQQLIDELPADVPFRIETTRSVLRLRSGRIEHHFRRWKVEVGVPKRGRSTCRWFMGHSRDLSMAVEYALHYYRHYLRDQAAKRQRNPRTPAPTGRSAA
jgi:hypothetical protein